MVTVSNMEFPTDRKYYTKDGAHLWLKLGTEGKTTRIGMDAFAAKNAGLLSFLAINKKKVKAHEAMGSFETAKFVSRLYAPVAGEIVAVNDEIISNPIQINEDPYSSWIVELKPENPDEMDSSEFIITGGNSMKAWIKKEMEEGDDE